jgi:hypothetical protein
MPQKALQVQSVFGSVVRHGTPSCVASAGLAVASIIEQVLLVVLHHIATQKRNSPKKTVDDDVRIESLFMPASPFGIFTGIGFDEW